MCRQLMDRNRNKLTSKYRDKKTYNTYPRARYCAMYIVKKKAHSYEHLSKLFNWWDKIFKNIYLEWKGICVKPWLHFGFHTLCRGRPCVDFLRTAFDTLIRVHHAYFLKGELFCKQFIFTLMKMKYYLKLCCQPEEFCVIMLL